MFEDSFSEGDVYLTRFAAIILAGVVLAYVISFL